MVRFMRALSILMTATGFGLMAILIIWKQQSDSTLLSAPEYYGQQNLLLLLIAGIVAAATGLLAGYLIWGLETGDENKTDDIQQNAGYMDHRTRRDLLRS